MQDRGAKSRAIALPWSFRSRNHVIAVWRAVARRAVVFITAFAVVIVVVNGVLGYMIIGNAPDNAVSRVDAVVVLGGEHDGREAYGLALARRGIASTVVLSDPYPVSDPLMRKACSQRDFAVEVICLRPDPATTRGEATMTRTLVEERNWKSILVISWRFHLTRARLLFCRCLSSSGVSVAAQAVPRHYGLPLWYWQYIYFYQFAGIANAVTTGNC